jgi:uncharacterized repeat protein (TIGR03803 family)
MKKRSRAGKEFVCIALLPIALLATLFAASLAQAQSYKVLYSFTGPIGDASWPDALLLASDGTLYGGSCYGGVSYHGAAFAFSPQGKESVLYSFLAGYGSCVGSLLLWNDDLYGDTADGGSNGEGAIFRLDKKGNETVLYSFQGFPNGNSSGLAFADGKGNFYGLTQNEIFKIDSQGNLTVVFTFSGGNSFPVYIVPDGHGNIYGATDGLFPTCNCGTLFKLSSAGVLTTLYTFTGGATGSDPGGLVLDEEGNIYGTATEDGTTNATCPNGCGLIYELTASGAYKVLYSFTGTPDGITPDEIVRDTAGNLYGITTWGGDTNCYHGFNNGIGCGIVFKLDTTGEETILHSFAGAPDGAYVQSLILDPAGTLYGVTFTGGDANCTMALIYIGCGTIFELTP